MAKFTAAADLNIRLPGGFEAVGTSGTTHRIPDALVDEFIRDVVPSIPGGVVWITQDETTDIPALSASLSNKYDKAGGTISGAVTVTGALVAQSTFSAVGNATFSNGRFKGEPWYDVKAYGATGDGSTDDTTAIQSAITAASGKVLHFSQGNYRITGALTLSSANTRIVGNAATITQATNSTSIFVVTADAVSIEGLTLAETGTSGGSTETNYGSGAVFKLCRDGLVRDCTIISAGHSASAAGGALSGAAIWFTGATNCASERNTIVRGAMGVNTDAFYGKSGGNRIVGNLFSATSRGYVLELQGGQASASLGDVFHDNMVFDTIDKAIVVDTAQNGFEVSGNRVVGAGSQGVAVLGTCAEGRILSNFISGTDSGITLNHLSGVSIDRMVIRDNVLIDNTNEGVSFYSLKDTVIAGNRIAANGRIGLHSPAGFPERLTIEGNVVRDNGQDGIYLVDPIDIIIRDNLVISNSSATTAAFDGIRIGKDAIDAKNILVSGNIVGATDTANHPNRHRYAFNNTVAGQSGIRLTGNIFSNGYVSSSISDSAGNIERFRNLPGDKADILIHAGARREGGTAFPTGPTTGDIFYRTDRAIEYWYDGARWLSTTLYRETISPAEAAPGTTTANAIIGRWSPWSTTYWVYIEKLYTSLLVATTNTTSAYWSPALRKSTAAGASTTIATATTSAGAADTWLAAETNVAHVLDATTYKHVDVSAGKTGTPGGLYFALAISYRLIG